jgi:hypothetical protein
VPEAAMPAKKTTSPPGKIKPINNPVSIKITPRTPINPRVDTTDWASNKFISVVYRRKIIFNVKFEL